MWSNVAKRCCTYPCSQQHRWALPTPHQSGSRVSSRSLVVAPSGWQGQPSQKWYSWSLLLDVCRCNNDTNNKYNVTILKMIIIMQNSVVGDSINCECCSVHCVSTPCGGLVIACTQQWRPVKPVFLAQWEHSNGNGVSLMLNGRVKLPLQYKCHYPLRTQNNRSRLKRTYSVISAH